MAKVSAAAKKLGRPCEVDKSKIQHVARRLFAEQGFVATSIRQVALKAKCNIAMISYYFGNKEGLLTVILNDYFSQGRTAYQDQAEVDKTFKEFKDVEVRNFVNSLYHFGCYALENRDIHKIIMRDTLSGGNQLVSALNRNSSGIVPLIKGHLELLINTGKFSPEINIPLEAYNLISPILYACLCSTCVTKIYGIEKVDDDFMKELCASSVRKLLV